MNGDRVEYQLLGSMAVSRSGAPLVLGGFRQRAVLAGLLLSADRTVELVTLIELVWDDVPPSKPISSIRAYVANLRRILGDDQRSDRLLTEARGYRLQLGSDRLDIHEFELQIGHGKRLLDAADPLGAVRKIERALLLWRGAPLTEFRDQPFVNHEIHRLEALRADAVETRFEAELLRGRHAEIVSGLEAEVAANPMRERLWGQLMLAMYRAGRRADALHAYGRLQAILEHELAVRPGLALDRLASEIRSESADLDWQPAQSGAALALQKGRRSEGIFGRSRERERLHAALTAASNGRGSVAVLIGESGVGKTALAAEIAGLADDLGMATVWAGHAGEARKPPSWAWTQALRAISGQVGHQRSAGGGTAPLPDWWNEVAEQGGVDDTEARSGFALTQATATAVADLAMKWPAVIVLDDLHRADRLTRDVVELLAASIHRLPMLILATWQDGGVDRPVRARAFDRLLSRSDVLTIRLRGIGPEAAAELIEDLSGTAPRQEFVADVSARTGGNPFYIRELTRLLHDSGRLDDSTCAIDGEDVPDAVSGIIRRRMADLPRVTRGALSAAAVLGIEFASARLAAALGHTVTEIAAQLDPAIGAGLIGDSPGAPGRYRFSHGLVRDAVAAQIPGATRAKLHAAAAHAFAGEPVHIAAGAEHAWRAGAELNPAVALQLVDRARQEAWGRAAYREVAQLGQRALDICTRLPADEPRLHREADLRLQLASVEAVVNGQSSVKVLDELRRSPEIGPDADQFTTAVAMGCLEACGSGRYHEAVVLSDGLIAYFDNTHDALAGSAGYYIRALVQFMRGRLDAALESIATLHGDVPSVDWEKYGALAAFEVISHGVAAHAYALRGDMGRARSALTAGIAMSTARHDAFGTAVVRTAEIQMAAMTGAHTGVADRADEIVGELAAMGIDQFVPGAQIVSAWARAMEPDGMDTSQEIRAALVLHAQGGRRIFSPLYYALLSDVRAAYGDTDVAGETLDKAELIATATGERVWDTQLLARRLKLRADSFRSDPLRA
jgi:DNA-binding SARP family transcriptional activator